MLDLTQDRSRRVEKNNLEVEDEMTRRERGGGDRETLVGVGEDKILRF